MKYSSDLLENLPDEYSWDSVSAININKALSLYPTLIPTELSDLEELRLHIIPAAIKARSANSDAFLEKHELVSLVKWKLKHGTFRPRLISLVESNDASTIKDATQSAFKLLSADSSSVTPSTRLVDALEPLIQLKGVGPATASLILSSAAEETAPFFSDELFRWVSDPFADAAVFSTKSAGNWKRGTGEIKYNKKEYQLLCTKVDQIRKRLAGVSALDLEKTAFVLGRVSPDVISGGESTTEEDKAAAFTLKTNQKTPATDEKLPKYTEAHKRGAPSKASRSSKRIKRS